jgi:hypothetical protein
MLRKKRDKNLGDDENGNRVVEKSYRKTEKTKNHHLEARTTNTWFTLAL